MEFLTGKELEKAIYDTLFEAEKYLIIISPYIQLGDYLKDNVFKRHLNNSKVHIILGFGKNEQNIERSFKKQDIEYFLKFPNITVVYIPELHGKYYGNERKSVITSMNLIDYSLRHNVEFGVYSEKTLLDIKKFFEVSQNRCFEIINDGYTIFAKRPNYSKRFFGLSKDYVGSDIQLNLVDDVFSKKKIQKISFSSFSTENYVNLDKMEQRIDREVVDKKIPEKEKGHCIRCNTEINLNPYASLCDKCYSVWVSFGNPNYLERYCHSCGERKVEVSVAKPLCYNCYKKSK